MNRTAFYLFGFGMALVGWAVMFSGLTTLNPDLSPTGKPLSISGSLIPPKGFLAVPVGPPPPNLSGRTGTTPKTGRQ